MGMLDDAIREHLDLKRRQGTDPSEIAQLETEALGGKEDSEPEVEAEAELVEVEEIVAEEPPQSETPEPEQDLLIAEELSLIHISEPTRPY